MQKYHCLLVLHGRTTRGTDDRFCGFTDPPLSPSGQQEVLNLRQRLQNEKVRLPETWYVSDRRRTVETFEIMTAGLRTPVVRLTDKLREINFGEYENLTWAELPLDFQRNYEAAQSSPFDLKFPQGESFRDLCERVSAGALEVLSYAEGDPEIGIIGHQGSLRVWTLMAAGLPPSAFFDKQQEHGAAHWVDLSAADVAQWRRKHLLPPVDAAFAQGGTRTVTFP